MTMPPSASILRDSQYFASLYFADDDANDKNGDGANAGTMSSAGVRFATANELRLGKYCIIHGFPCRIKDIKKSQAGKHGHAKIRVVGVGLFDQRKRENIFGSHDKVLIPKVEIRSNIFGIATNDGFDVVKGYQVVASANGDKTDDLPSIVYWADEAEEENKPEHGILTIAISCGYYRVTTVHAISKEEADEMRKNKENQATQEAASSVLSKKEQRKLKKAMKKQQATAVD